MTVLQLTYNLLDARWEPSITGRTHDVPKPDLYKEAPDGVRRTSVDEADRIVVKDLGPTQYDPRSFGWVEERQQFTVGLDVRTTVSRIRFYGERDTSSDPLGDSPRYGGIAGETKRVLDTARKGEKEFDLIEAYEFNDITGEMGGSVYRGQFAVRFREIAHTIDTST